MDEKIVRYWNEYEVEVYLKENKIAENIINTLKEWYDIQKNKKYLEKCEEDYQDGCEDGYQNGYESGYEDGQEDGYSDGYDTGEEDGYNKRCDEEIEGMKR